LTFVKGKTEEFENDKGKGQKWNYAASRTNQTHCHGPTIIRV